MRAGGRLAVDRRVYITLATARRQPTFGLGEIAAHRPSTAKARGHSRDQLDQGL